jgi:hypothetical protein
MRRRTAKRKAESVRISRKNKGNSVPGKITFSVMLAFLCLFFDAPGLYSQVNDAGLWISVNAEKKITAAFSACFTEELRMNENITEAGTVFSDIGLYYKIGKRFKVSASYRFTKKRRLDDSYDSRHGFYIDLGFKEKVRPFALLARVRYQSQYTDVYTSEKGEVPKSHAVLKITLKYEDLGRVVPYVYAESYYRVNNALYSAFDQLRLCGGIEYTLNRMHAVDIHYLFNKEYNVKHPETDYVIGIGYYFTF